MRAHATGSLGHLVSRTCTLCMHLPSTFPVTQKRLPTHHIHLCMLHMLLYFLATVLLAFPRCDNLINFHETRVFLSCAFQHTLVTPGPASCGLRSGWRQGRGGRTWRLQGTQTHWKCTTSRMSRLRPWVAQFVGKRHAKP